jgi:hypothetical protein
MKLIKEEIHVPTNKKAGAATDKEKAEKEKRIDASAKRLDLEFKKRTQRKLCLITRGTRTTAITTKSFVSNRHLRLC